MRRLVVFVAALALLAAGCGGGGGTEGGGSSPPLTKAQYQTKLEQIAKEVGSQISSSSNQLDKLTGADLKKLTDALHRFADRLEEVNPPAKVAKLHQGLIQAMNDLADEFPEIAKKLKGTKDPSAAISALFGAKGVQELIKLGDGFKQAGYNLDLNGP